MRRVFAALVGVSLVASACGGGGSVLSQQAGGSEATVPTTGGTAPASSAAVTETTAAAPAATGPATSTEAPSAAPSLLVRQIVVRYDGLTGTGTLAATVCNLGEAAEPAPTVTIAANGFAVVLGAGPIDSMGCADLFDATVDLTAFGVTGPGPVDVSVSAVASAGGPEAGDTVVEAIEVPGVMVVPPADQLQLYGDCLASGQNHRNCVGHIPYHPIGDAGEVMWMRGRYLAIGPSAFEGLLSFFLADDQACTPRLEDWMGIEGPTPIAHRLVVADDYGGGYAAPFVEVYSIGSEEEWGVVTTYLARWWSDNLAGRCNNAHELTHLILGDTPMPSWLNEGLATYLQDEGRSGYGGSQPVECRETGWYGSLFEGGEAEVPYQDLMDYDTDVPGIYYYYTAMCFWDYVETEYGGDKVREIIHATADHRDPGYNGCIGLTGSVLFIRDIVNPILGVDVSPFTQAKWGFGSTFTGCEG